MVMTEDEMQRLYQWIDEIPLSRPKRNIGRDFSDGGVVFVAASTLYASPSNSLLLASLRSAGGGAHSSFFPKAGRAP